MSNNAIIKALSLFVGASILGAGSAAAQVPGNYKYDSTSRPVYLHLNMPSGCDPFVTASVNAWNNAGSRFRYSFSSSANLTSSFDDVQNSTRTTIQPGATDAIMSARRRTSGSRLLDADVIVSEARLFYGTTPSTRESGGQFHCSASTAVANDKLDFQTALTHELGHALGLDHTYDTKCSMYLYQTFGDVRRTLCSAERTTIRGLYGS